MSRQSLARLPWNRWFLNAILTTLIFSLTRVTVEGREHFPARGPFLIIFNHTHWLDPTVLVNKSPRYAVPMAKAETKNYPGLGYLLRGYHVIFVHRGVADLTALRQARHVLEAGHGVLLAPEGTRSPDGRLQRGRPGLVFLARGLNTAIVPAAVTGVTDFNLKRNLTHLYRTPISVRIGPAFRFRMTDTKLRSAEQQALTDAAMQRIARLLPPELRGYYTREEPALDELLEPIETVV